MDSNSLEAFLFPQYQQRVEEFKLKNKKFIHYTSAEAVHQIITKKSIWLRNVRLMNDWSEIYHGLNLLVKEILDNQKIHDFVDRLNSIHPDIVFDAVQAIRGSKYERSTQTYIASFSEHLSGSEDLYGRLSMWRAYGGKQPVAVVLNETPFFGEADELGAFTSSVLYANDINKFLDQLLENLIQYESSIAGSSREDLLNKLHWAFLSGICCLKHMGFEEEREWRVIHMPDLMPSKYIKSDTVIINGIPQVIYKLPIKEIPEIGFLGSSIPKVINKLIIGPNEHQFMLWNHFVGLLKAEGCENPEDKVVISNIPLRNN
ncbi:DUF2971 domain-containing protein [Marinicella sp. W31]|uniref:DUF2971 domain-containing protein n=1 Tax=Marinicella sp. W31 TaxID=3023713 RepID=UPI003757B464